MIRFLRGIRQKLIDEGKLKNYLFYATGEIILLAGKIVMIKLKPVA